MLRVFLNAVGVYRVLWVFAKAVQCYCLEK